MIQTRIAHCQVGRQSVGTTTYDRGRPTLEEAYTVPVSLTAASRLQSALEIL